jgi:hypothetical protein
LRGAAMLVLTEMKCAHLQIARELDVLVGKQV